MSPVDRQGEGILRPWPRTSGPTASVPPLVQGQARLFKGSLSRYPGLLLGGKGG